MSGREDFKQFLSTLYDIPTNEWESCADRLISEKFTSRQVIQQTGEVCDKVRFLVSGLARSYLFDEQGREFTWSLHFAEPDANLKNRFLVDYASFTQTEPSHLCIEALTDVEVVAIRKSDTERLYAESPLWANIGRRIADLAYYYTHHRALSLLSLPARERYEQLLGESPAMVRVAPQHYIASYLGITPQSLSRLRRELALPNVNDAENADE